MAKPRIGEAYLVGLSELPSHVRQLCRDWPEGNAMGKVARGRVGRINLSRLQFELRARHGKILTPELAGRFEAALGWCDSELQRRKPPRKGTSP